MKLTTVIFFLLVTLGVFAAMFLVQGALCRSGYPYWACPKSLF